MSLNACLKFWFSQAEVRVYGSSCAGVSTLGSNPTDRKNDGTLRSRGAVSVGEHLLQKIYHSPKN